MLYISKCITYMSIYIKYISKCIHYISKYIKYISKCIHYKSNYIKYISKCITYVERFINNGFVEISHCPLQAVEMLTILKKTNGTSTLNDKMTTSNHLFIYWIGQDGPDGEHGLDDLQLGVVEQGRGERYRGQQSYARQHVRLNKSFIHLSKAVQSVCHKYIVIKF